VLKGVLEGFEDHLSNLRGLGWTEDDGIPSVEQLALAKKAVVADCADSSEVDTKASYSPTAWSTITGWIPRIFGRSGPVVRPTTLVGPDTKVKLALCSKAQLSRDTVKYTFALPSPEHCLGLPIGQHVALSTMMRNPRTGGELKYTARKYTPVSNDDDLGVVEFVIKTYYKEQHPRFPDGGWLSQHMDGMEIGDTLDFRGPSGKIIYKGNGIFSVRGKEKRYTHVGLISGGTGVTPCYQLMKYAAQHSEPLSISLLSANVSKHDILLKSELEGLSAKGLKVAYTVDSVNDEDAWSGYVGFINETMVRETMPPPGEHTIVLTCGPPMMIEKCVQPICKNLGYTTVIDY